MANSRRTFLAVHGGPGRGSHGRDMPFGAQSGAAPGAVPPCAPRAPSRRNGPLTPVSEIQVPKIKFGHVTIGGCPTSSIPLKDHRVEEFPGIQRVRHGTGEIRQP